MSSSNVAAISAFIQGAPPGELAEVVSAIKTLVPSDPTLLEKAQPAFKQYHEEQLMALSLPNQERRVLVSEHNALGNGRYFDPESQSSFALDHMTSKASDVKPHSLDTQHLDLITSINRTLAAHAREHYASSAYAVYPTEADSSLAILLVATRYSPSNFWNGRFRTKYTFSPSENRLSGILHVDVHYYEDGNVRLTTSKKLAPTSIASGSAAEIVREIATVEKKYQEELNRGFNTLSEGEFKGLRRQLPVTRQKVEWEKIMSYKAGKEMKR